MFVWSESSPHQELQVPQETTDENRLEYYVWRFQIISQTMIIKRFSPNGILSSLPNGFHHNESNSCGRPSNVRITSARSMDLIYLCDPYRTGRRWSRWNKLLLRGISDTVSLAKAMNLAGFQLNFISVYLRRTIQTQLGHFYRQTKNRLPKSFFNQLVQFRKQ